MERKRSKDSNQGTDSKTKTSQKILLTVQTVNDQRTKAKEPEAKIPLPQRESEFRAKEMILLSTVSWFWGKIKPPQICYLMQDAENGTFLVTGFERSEGDYYNPEYSISVKLCGKVFIFNVQHQNGELCLDFSDPHQPRAMTLYALMSKILQKSKIYGGVGEILTKCGKISVSLRYPVARISSLRAHCRRIIRLTYEKQDIEDFPVPRALKRYLNAI